MPSVTAIILTYDRLHMLKRSVASARWQTHGDLEILVVCNGAGDDTRAWLASVDDPRLLVLELPTNISPPLARNEGLAAAGGEWVGFMDDDDVWAPDKVESMVNAAVRADRCWAYCGAIYIDPDGGVISGRPPLPLEELVHELPVAYTVPGGLSGMMWRTDALPDGGLIDEAMTYCSDWDISLRLLAAGLPAHDDRPLVGYRQHPGAWSRGVALQQDEFDMIERKHATLRGTRHIHRGEHYRYVAAQAARAGDRREALQLYLSALRHRDSRSLSRIMGALLPVRLQLLARRVLLSDPDYIAEGTAWMTALYNQR